MISLNGVKKRKNSSDFKSQNNNYSVSSKKPKIPLAYVYVYYKLREILKKRCTITFLQTSEVLNALQMTIKVPKRMKYLVLAEMEEYGLLKRINHQRYWISNKPNMTRQTKRITDCMIGCPFW